ncbi:hypothetical protein HDE_03300 [Halotydeus destructor]|nr:hypothetical protein HDE_03300 [Halotydeus destructor]
MIGNLSAFEMPKLEANNAPKPKYTATPSQPRVPEAILGRKVINGQDHFIVKWKDSFVPESGMSESCKDLIEELDARTASAKK